MIRAREQAETSAAAVSNIKFDKVVVWDGGNGGGAGEGNATSNFIRGLAKSLPPTADILKEVRLSVVRTRHIWRLRLVAFAPSAQ